MFNAISKYLTRSDLERKYEVWDKYTGETIGTYDSRGEANAHQTSFSHRVRMVRVRG
jgi:hypothetical protein